ncbi:exported hypothetical protein [Crenothrix polyspora]|uniref:LamG domain-containing protein n=1 Tax=Crenothrix polyspora TaxID=360316 RepID=A0A1R4HE66_9GAMM|nr:LamG-like jellyroll fold domain-containing protein [Crenothrix polyspora]SJM94321.1 exported hypothetical protein [Crenothrix polyspora]
MPLVFNYKHPAQTFKHWQFIVGFLVLFACIGNSTANAALTTGLVAHYCFDDRANLGKDCSGKGNKGVVQGGVSYTTEIRGGGAKFGGIKKPGDILVKNSASLRFSKALTVSAFVKITDGVGMDGNTANAAVGRHTILAKSHDISGFWMAAQIDKTNKFTSYGANNSYVKPSFGFGSATTKDVKKAKWVHVVYVIANGVARIYYDGVLVSTTKKGAVNFSLPYTFFIQK